MMFDDIVLNKKESIERCIQQIRRFDAMPSTHPFEKDFLKQDAIAMNLQRAIEQTIALANHVVRVRKLGIPKESRESFLLLYRAGILSKELCDHLCAMVGFRNTLVHQYQKLDIEILRDVIDHHLEDLIDFTVQIMKASDDSETLG